MSASKPKTVAVCLQGSVRHELDAGLWRLWLEREPEEGLAMRVRVDPAAPVAWRELDRLRHLIELEYQGTDARVAAYVTGRKTLRTFRWLLHGQTRIDLAKSALTELSLDVRAPLALKLPRSLTTLRLLDVSSWNKLAIQTDDGGARLAVWIWAPPKPVRALAGLPALAALSVAATASLDLAMVAKHPKLASIEVFGVDAGVEIDNLRRLASLRQLEAIKLTNTFHTDFSTLPSPKELPALRTLQIDGVREEAARSIRERWRGFAGLSVRGVRSDAWLRANADNPFRTWAEEHDDALGQRATKAYRTAHAALGPKPTRKHAEATLRAFVDAFNAVEDRIDTIMREEIDGAYCQLAERVAKQVPFAQAAKWFDAWREF